MEMLGSSLIVCVFLTENLVRLENSSCDTREQSARQASRRVIGKQDVSYGREVTRIGLTQFWSSVLVCFHEENGGTVFFIEPQ